MVKPNNSNMVDIRNPNQQITKYTCLILGLMDLEIIL